MFSVVPSASKLALIHLARHMESLGGEGFIDCQLETPHLKSMGARYISYEEFIKGTSAYDTPLIH
jgi:leucyl/phenylalanyl-tRNA--protein transferase